MNKENLPIQRCCCGSPQLTESWGCWARTRCPWIKGTSLLPVASEADWLSDWPTAGCTFTQPGSSVQRSRCHSNSEVGARPAQPLAQTLNDSGYQTKYCRQCVWSLMSGGCLVTCCVCGCSSRNEAICRGCVTAFERRRFGIRTRWCNMMVLSVSLSFKMTHC